jgi:MFS family permease
MSDGRDSGASRRAAMHLIILFGLVSLFGDIVYEGARSVNGPYLKTLGANAAIVGLIAGAGEFVGYAVRLFSGYFADRTRAYWLLTFFGYGALVSVPLLSLAGVWQLAALFIVVERFGKALRAPARDTIVSQAAKQVGTGFGFGLHEAMDQIGAIAGPLIFSGLFLATGAGGKGAADYQAGFRFLWIPFALVMLCIVFAYLRVPDPARLEPSVTPGEPEPLTHTFWLYNVFTAVTTLGFVNVVLLAYHFKHQGIMPDAHIPLVYAVAMAVDGVAAVAVGLWYDRLKAAANSERAGILTLVALPVLSAAVPVLGFTRNYWLGGAAVLLWGVIMGAHETVMRSAVADLTPVRRRGTGYGVFNMTYGVSIALGTIVSGLLYETSLRLMVVYCVVMQALAAAFFLALRSAALQPASAGKTP